MHAVKPEPHWAIPQGQSAHDTFWDYVSYSLRRCTTSCGQCRIAVFHGVIGRWKVRHSHLPSDQCTRKRPLSVSTGNRWQVKPRWYGMSHKTDRSRSVFHRRDLWEAIEAGDFPEYELGLQLIAEEDEFKFDFDLLDPTKLIPEELVPVQRVGKMVLNRNPDNFFAENEQAAFHPDILFPALILPTIRCYRGVCSLIPTRKSAVWAGQTSTKFRLTALPAPTITSSVTVCTGWISTPIRRTMNRTPLMTTGRAKRRQRQNAAASNHTRTRGWQ